MEQIHNNTLAVLTAVPASRDDDDILYTLVCEKINPDVCKLGFSTVMLNRAQYGLPNIGSVTRARRKIQRSTPELRCSEHASKKRYEHWKRILDYVQK